jgi:tetratricopeptide (TPR) repeat protein
MKLSFKISHPYYLTWLSMIVTVGAVLISNQWVSAAGAPSSSASQPAAMQTRRQKANEFFRQAESYQKAERYNDAAAAYEKAVQTDPDYAEAHSNLGFCLRKQKMFDKAIESYQRAIAINPKLTQAHEYIGEAYAEMGKFDLAERHLNILKTLDSNEAAELEAFIRKAKTKS